MYHGNLTGFTEEMNRMALIGKPFLFIIDYSLSAGILVNINECASHGIFYYVEGNSNYLKTTVQGDIRLESDPVPYSVYLEAFQIVQEEIQKGNSYLVNLTFSTPIASNACLTELFNASAARYQLLFKDQFLVFSPECFVKIYEGKISTFPMKGTIDASLEHAEELLLMNEKETAEHATIVDLLRNDISRISKNVRVEKFRVIEKITTSGKNLLQMSSVISGDLDVDHKKKIGDIIFSLLPAGSISGAPKKATLEIISKAEKHERGFYTGIFGIFDGVNLNSGVMIRFIENQNGQLIYKSGGGITSKSDPVMEYQELIDKIYVPFN